MTEPSRLDTLERAEALADQQRYPEAVALCDRVIAEDFNSAAALNLKGFCLARLGRIEEALAEFRRARLALPVYPPIRFNLARALDDLGRIDEARGEYDETLRLDPEHSLARVYRGFLRARQGDPAGAQEDLDEAVRLDPGIPEAWVLRGACRLMARRPDLAREDFSRALELDPAQKPRIEKFITELA